MRRSRESSHLLVEITDASLDPRLTVSSRPPVTSASDLSGNKLKTVPPVIFTMTKLKTLYVVALSIVIDSVTVQVLTQLT